MLPIYKGMKKGYNCFEGVNVFLVEDESYRALCKEICCEGQHMYFVG